MESQTGASAQGLVAGGTDFQTQFNYGSYLIHKAKEAESKSKQLLEIAKTGVERAIETDEAMATAWINQQLEALGVNIS